MMITLTLLHPQHSVAVQTWRFQSQSSIRIGRSKNNEVTLYSAVVSRKHVEIKRKGDNWEVISLGANGTFYQGKRINRTIVENGMIIRLASSGPQIQIWTEQTQPEKEPEPLQQSSTSQQTTASKQQGERQLSQEELEKAKQTQND